MKSIKYFIAFSWIFLAMHDIGYAQDANQKENDLPENDLPEIEDGGKIQSNAYGQALTHIEYFLDHLTSLQARFIQHNPNGKQAKGVMYLSRPGRIRFDYDDETPYLIVSDGNNLNFIDYEIGQISKWPVADTPLRIFLEDSKARTLLSRLNAEIRINPQGLANHIGLRVHDPEKPENGIIMLFFKQRDDQSQPLQLSSWIVEDAQGRVTLVELEDVRENIELASDLWTFEDPRGLNKRRRVR